MTSPSKRLPRTAHTIDTAFWLGDVVYRRVDRDNDPGIVTGVHIRPAGVLYSVQFPNEGEDSFYEITLSDTPAWVLDDSTLEDEVGGEGGNT